ncbi:conserved protein of unknown function [Serratia sp. Tan611]|nr:conserved protein of unknown function [Serratia sp. Tan611]
MDSKTRVVNSVAYRAGKRLGDVTIDDMREMLTNATHVNLALLTVKQNEVVKKLACWL